MINPATIKPTPLCVLCAIQRCLLNTWVDTRGLNLRGTCADCGFIAATVNIPFAEFM